MSLEAPYNNSTDYSYRWTVAGTSLPQGLDAIYTIKTGDLDVNHRYRLFCDVTKDGVMQRVIAFFELQDDVGTIGLIGLRLMVRQFIKLKNQHLKQPINCI